MKLKDENLRNDFVEQVEILRKKIKVKIKPKVYNGKKINGSIFLSICKYFHFEFFSFNIKLKNYFCDEYFSNNYKKYILNVLFKNFFITKEFLLTKLIQISFLQ